MILLLVIWQCFPPHRVRPHLCRYQHWHPTHSNNLAVRWSLIAPLGPLWRRCLRVRLKSKNEKTHNSRSSAVNGTLLTKRRFRTHCYRDLVLMSLQCGFITVLFVTCKFEVLVPFTPPTFISVSSMEGRKWLPKDGFGPDPIVYTLSVWRQL